METERRKRNGPNLIFQARLRSHSPRFFDWLASLGIMRKARCATAVAEESPAPASDSPKPADPGPEVGMVCKHEAIGSVRDKFAITDAMTLNDLLGRSPHNSSTN